MRCVHRAIDYKQGNGTVKLIAEEAEDMWHVYNLLQVGDTLSASTYRKIQTESSTGSVTNKNRQIHLTLAVEDIHFDVQACLLRVKGRNIRENEYVKLGAYHTIDLELNRAFTLGKEEWDSIALQRLNQACDPTQTADLAAVVMQEGLAYVCLVTSCMTLTRAKIEINIPRKRRGDCSQHDKALNKFYDQIMQAIARHINFDVVKCVVLASPGFLKDQFYDWMMATAVRTDNRLFIENKSKFLRLHSSSGHKHALKELLTDSAIANQLQDTKAYREVQILAKFYERLQQDQDMAVYGIKHVEKAARLNAIESLLITDKLFRSNDIATRKRYVALRDLVYRNLGREEDIHVFSSLHVSGEQLGQLTGVAAICRFPVPDDDIEYSDSDSD